MRWEEGRGEQGEEAELVVIIVVVVVVVIVVGFRVGWQDMILNVATYRNVKRMRESKIEEEDEEGEDEDKGDVGINIIMKGSVEKGRSERKKGSKERE